MLSLSIGTSKPFQPPQKGVYRKQILKCTNTSNPASKHQDGNPEILDQCVLICHMIFIFLQKRKVRIHNRNTFAALTAANSLGCVWDSAGEEVDASSSPMIRASAESPWSHPETIKQINSPAQGRTET